MRISPLLGSTRPVAEAAQVSAVFAAGLAAGVVEEVVLASCVLACVVDVEANGERHDAGEPERDYGRIDFMHEPSVALSDL